MAQQPSEEKSLPASEKKLRDARKKGQVSKASDIVTAMIMFGCTLYLVVSAGEIESRVRGLLALTLRLYEDPFDTLWPRLIAASMEVLLYSVLPLILITVAAAILTNLIIMRGALFSTEPIKPKFEHINPAEGLKRIFSMRGVVEFCKSLFKIVALGAVFIVVFRLGLQALMESSRCGYGCLLGTFVALLQPLIIAVLIVFLVVGLLDIRVQRWLFLRDQRMTHSEHKRERKDMDGDPEVRKARQRQRQEMQAYASRAGVERASVLLGTADDWVVGIRYVSGETPVPVMVCKADPQGSRALLREAAALGLPVVAHRELAQRIGGSTGNGEPVPEGTFQAVADILVASGVI